MMKWPCPWEACHLSTRDPSKMHQNIPQPEKGRAGSRNMRSLLSNARACNQKVQLMLRTKKSTLYHSWPCSLGVQLCASIHSPSWSYQWLCNKPPHFNPAITDPSWFCVQNCTAVLAEEPHKIFSRIVNITSLLNLEKVSLPLTYIPISNL